MLKKLKEHIEKLHLSSTKKVDTSRFNDPLAETVDWHPMKIGGANFATNVLKKTSSSTYRYKASIGAWLFCGIFIAVGLIMLFTGLGLLFEIGGGAQFILGLFGVTFSAAGFFLLKNTNKSINFDSMHGYLWIGNKRPQLAGNTLNKQNIIHFNEIHAIQVISEHVNSNKSSYYSYEINFILKDGSRFHLIDHGNRKRIQQDVTTLSKIINKPVWNDRDYR